MSIHYLANIFSIRQFVWADKSGSIATYRRNTDEDTQGRIGRTSAGDAEDRRKLFLHAENRALRSLELELPDGLYAKPIVCRAGDYREQCVQPVPGAMRTGIHCGGKAVRSEQLPGTIRVRCLLLTFSRRCGKCTNSFDTSGETCYFRCKIIVNVFYYQLQEARFVFLNNDIKLVLRSSALYTNSTLCIIKPHAVREGKAGEIITEILRKKFTVTAIKMLRFERPNCEEFLEVYKGVVPEYEVRGGMVSFERDEQIIVLTPFIAFLSCSPW